MKFKVGDKVELLYGGNKWPLIGYENGEIYTVAKFPKDVIENHIKNGLIPITGGLQKRGYAKPEQLKLVEPKKTKKQRITELEKQVANLLERVEALEKHRLIAGETLDKFTESQADIIEFEGQQYRKVEREAREGDVVVFRENLYGGLKNGLPYKVTTRNGFLVVAERIYLYQQDFGRTPETIDVYKPIKQEKTPNQQRAEIIEKAKRFVEESKKETSWGEKMYHVPNRVGGGWWCNVKFKVNEHKRAVTALIYWKPKVFDDYKPELKAKGIAKCHPQDVFNEHIGKAIALGRALGLDVSEFEQAVQPNKVVVGHRIRRNYFGSNKTYERTVTEISPTKVKYKNGYWDYKANVDIDSTIIDDTNAIYEVTANAQRPYQTHNA